MGSCRWLAAAAVCFCGCLSCALQVHAHPLTMPMHNVPTSFRAVRLYCARDECRLATMQQYISGSYTVYTYKRLYRIYGFADPTHAAHAQCANVFPCCRSSARQGDKGIWTSSSGPMRMARFGCRLFSRTTPPASLICASGVSPCCSGQSARAVPGDPGEQTISSAVVQEAFRLSVWLGGAYAHRYAVLVP